MASYLRKSKEIDERGIDDWLMTYADMITLLLCFFAIFLAVSIPKKDAFVQAREKVLETFSSDPDQMKRLHLDGTEKDKQMGETFDALPSIFDRFHVDTSMSEKIIKGREIEERSKKEKPDGDRIFTIEMPSAAFFASGSATLSEEGKALLRGIREKDLQDDKIQNYIITIEGHTDDAPIKTLQFPSNWELSTARAASVVRHFIELGIAPQKLRASGYADSFPKSANRDYAGNPIPENQAQNRRVIIKLEKIIKDER